MGASKVAKTGALKSAYVTLSLVPVVLLICSLINFLRQAHLEASQRFLWLYNLVILSASAFSLLDTIVPMSRTINTILNQTCSRYFTADCNFYVLLNCNFYVGWASGWKGWWVGGRGVDGSVCRWEGGLVGGWLNDQYMPCDKECKKIRRSEKYFLFLTDYHIKGKWSLVKIWGESFFLSIDLREEPSMFYIFNFVYSVFSILWTILFWRVPE